MAVKTATDGRVSQVIGAVVDAEFPPGEAPAIFDAVEVSTREGRTVVMEVEQAIGENGRFALINVWRNIAEEPVATHALALCDAQTVTPKDLAVFELHYADRVGENYFSKQDPGHEWYSYPAMTRDEALLIKQWDSAGPLAQSQGQRPDSNDPHAPCTFSFHSSFDEASPPPNAPARWSIEVRCVVIYQ